jgi:hypothetical protein
MMEAKIIDVRAPRWTSAARSAVDVDVFHAEHGWIPFTATPNDSVDYGRVLFQAAIDGEFGEIADYVEPEKTLDEASLDLRNAVRQRLEETVRAHGYFSVDSTGKYQNISDEEIAALPEAERSQVRRFRDECRAFVVHVARTWSKCYAVLDEVEANKRPVPSEAELFAELPTMEWLE